MRLGGQSGQLVPPGQYAVIAAKAEYAPTERIVSGEIQNVRLEMERIALDSQL